MADLTPRWMWIKAGLFLIIGLVSCALILAQLPDWRVLVLLVMAIWAFCRAYYFAFYVLEKYIDPSFRFSGLGSLLRHVWSRRTR